MGSTPRIRKIEKENKTLVEGNVKLYERAAELLKMIIELGPWGKSGLYEDQRTICFNGYRLVPIDHNLKALILTVSGCPKFRLTERR